MARPPLLYQGNNILAASQPQEDDGGKAGTDDEDSYSHVEHIAMALYGNEWAEARIAMLTAYCDAAGHADDQPVLSVAGFVSTAKDWTDFEEPWLYRLKQDGLPYLHVNELTGKVWSCSKHQACTEHWTPSRLSALLMDLAGIISRHVYRKLGCTVVIETIEKIAPDIKERLFINAYSLAGSVCAYQLRGFAALEMKTAYEPLMIFESGDKGRHQLEQVFSVNEWSRPYFAPGKKDRITKDGLIVKHAVPLQAADLLAYNLFDMNRKIHKDGSLYDWRPEYREFFHPMLGMIEIARPNNIAKFEEELTTMEFLDWWTSRIKHETQE